VFGFVKLVMEEKQLNPTDRNERVRFAWHELSGLMWLVPYLHIPDG